MEIDWTIVTNDELEYWCKEFPDLTRDEVCSVLECIEIEEAKRQFWKENPSLDEATINSVVAKNAVSSYEYYLYRDFNNEAP